MPSAIRGRARAWAVNGALSLLSVLVVFGAAEGLLRLTALAPSRALRSPDLRTLDRIPGLYDPGQEFVDRVRRDLPSRIRINNLGFRGPDLRESKPPGVFRVMALGDSYAFGDHVDTEQSYPSQLERRLAARLAGAAAGRPGPGEGIGAAARVEVVNAGVNGFGILDMIALWEKAGRRLDPDVVLITFSPNDISDMTRPVAMIDQMRRNAGLKARPLVGPALRLLQNTAVFNGLQILAARWRIRARTHEAIPAVEPARAGPDRAPEAWEAYRQSLIRLAAMLRGDGRRALLILYPSLGNVIGEDHPHASEFAPGWARQADVECLDLLPAFREAAARGAVLYLVPRDSHPSAAGHALAAGQVAERLASLGWLPAPPGPPRPATDAPPGPPTAPAADS